MSTTQSLRIAFFGTTNFSAQHLYALVNTNHQIIIILTQNVDLSKDTTSLSINKIAKKHNIPLFQSNNLSISDIENIIQQLNLDLIVVVSYGLILSQKILHIPKLGCINVHASLLPRWRGSAPIQRALEYGDSITGISIIKMDVGIDTGNILYQVTCKILPKDTGYSLSKKLAEIGATALLKTIQKIQLNTYTLTPQNPNQATYARKLTKKEARINWKSSAIQLERRIRAFNPWPVNYFLIEKNITIKVWEAKISDLHTFYYYIKKKLPSDLLPGTILYIHSSGIHVLTGTDILILTMLQTPGKKIISANDILNAHRAWFLPNTILS